MRRSPTTPRIKRTVPRIRRPRPIRVLLGIDDPSHWGREIMLGVARFVREHGGWELIHGGRPGSEMWASLGSLRRYDAVITSRPSDPQAMDLHAAGMPMVAAGLPGPPTMHSVLADDVRVGRMAAEYLVSLGYQRIGMMADQQLHTARRWEGLVSWMAEHRLPAPVRYDSPPLTSKTAAARLQRWLAKLPKPGAVFGCNDAFGVSIIRACRGIGVAVPHDLSVLGVDNAAFDCEMVTPPLSSIDHSLRGVGYEAAEILAAILRGDPPPLGTRIVPPIGVVERGSTGVRAIADPVVTRALTFIRENATFGLGVEDVLEHVAVSRATLDRGFKHWLGRTASAEIQRCRIERARELLARTDLDMLDVGVKSGFNYRQQFHTAFRAATGLTPREYRRQARRT